MAALKQYRVLHFSAHALLPTDLACESEPAIVTSAPPGAPDASGAVLTASDVSTLSLDADAVVLSACNSGGPGGTAGESLSGLARAFFYAGARSMLVTHWSVNDQAAALLVADTLRRLRAGGGIAEALRGAELAILDDAGKGLPAAMQHPFYWAPFAVIGEGGARVGRAELSRDIRAERQAS
jgi:CHAT domain-containing protein